VIYMIQTVNLHSEKASEIQKEINEELQGSKYYTYILVKVRVSTWTSSVLLSRHVLAIKVIEP
jgi:hypothetical protein